MKKNILYVLSILIVLAAAWGWFFFYNSGSQTASIEESLPVKKENASAKEVALVIDDGEGRPQTFSAELKAGQTAFDLLNSQAQGRGLILKTKEYSGLGIMIESIGGIKNGDAGKYWIYYVNGQMASVSADKYQLKAGDKVEFKFEKSSF